MSDTNDYFQQKINYVTERAIAEESILQYIKQEYGDKLDLNKFVSDIVESHEDFLEENKDMMAYTNDDEHEYIAGKTNYSTEMIELILWFEECYLMKTDCIEYGGECIKCGGDKLYMREVKDELFVSEIECAACGEHYSLDEMYEYENNLLPLSVNTIEDSPIESVVTEDSYIFKAATGYRKGIWRKIQISTGAKLDDLAYAILDAFCFDRAHLYAFYMDEKGRTRNVPVYYSPECRDNPRADRVRLKDLNFAAGTKFLFLYDFGDEWHFTITYEKEVAEETQLPFIVQYRGEAPEQY